MSDRLKTDQRQESASVCPDHAEVSWWRPSLLKWLALAVLLIGADQLSKLYFVHHFSLFERRNILPFFDFILVYNEGAAFSFLADAAGWQRWFFLALGIGASIVIIGLLRKNLRRSFFCFCLTLIMAGALGNVIDRLVHGRVVDFLLFYYKNAYFPAFNVADSFITVGAIGLIAIELRNHFRKGH